MKSLKSSEKQLNCVIDENETILISISMPIKELYAYVKCLWLHMRCKFI